jgi:hypothetical protein
MDFLPGSFGFDPVADQVGADEAARVAWFDGLVQNVDRSWRNPNLLRWHGDLWLIDHGASLYFHHDWRTRRRAAGRPYPAAAEHVLLGRAGPLHRAHDALAPRVPGVLPGVLAEVPDAWLADEPGFDGPDDVRAAYAEVLGARADGPDAWLPAMEAARAARR